MTFAYPAVLLLLIAPILLLAWDWRRRGHPLALPFDHGSQRHSGILEILVKLTSLTGPALLAIAILLLAGPRTNVQPNDERVLTNIEFCLDVSGSMNSPFGDGKRSDKAYEAIMEFTGHRKGDAFGLTIFGTDVVQWTPVTKDLSALRSAAPFLRPDRMPPVMRGTRIGAALRSTKDLLSSRPEGDRMIALISDGVSYDLRGGVAQQIGEELAAENIVVYYIHVADGEPQGETYALASLTGGEAFSAGDPAALSEVFQHIDAMRPTMMKPSAPQAADYFGPFALAGLGFLAVQMLGILGLRYTPW